MLPVSSRAYSKDRYWMWGKQRWRSNSPHSHASFHLKYSDQCERQRSNLPAILSTSVPSGNWWRRRCRLREVSGHSSVSFLLVSLSATVSGHFQWSPRLSCSSLDLFVSLCSFQFLALNESNEKSTELQQLDEQPQCQSDLESNLFDIASDEYPIPIAVDIVA